MSENENDRPLKADTMNLLLSTHEKERRVYEPLFDEGEARTKPHVEQQLNQILSDSVRTDSSVRDQLESLAKGEQVRTDTPVQKQIAESLDGVDLEAMKQATKTLLGAAAEVDDMNGLTEACHDHISPNVTNNAQGSDLSVNSRC